MEDDAVENIFVSVYSEMAGITRTEAAKEFNKWLAGQCYEAWNEGATHGWGLSYDGFNSQIIRPCNEPLGGFSVETSSDAYKFGSNVRRTYTRVIYTPNCLTDDNPYLP